MYKNKSRLVAILFFSIVLFMLNSCATIFDGRKNTVKVIAGTPEKAKVYLDGKFIGEAPFKIRVSKFDLQEGSIIEIKKENYETLIYEVERNPHIGYIAADILGGVIPLVVDVADGNIYRPNTRKIEYKLVKVGEKKEVKTINNQKQDIR